MATLTESAAQFLASWYANHAKLKDSKPGASSMSLIPASLLLALLIVPMGFVPTGSALGQPISGVETSEGSTDALMIAREAPFTNVPGGFLTAIRTGFIQITAKRSNISLAEATDIVDTYFMPPLRSHYDDLLREVSLIFSEHFTQPELHQIRTYLEDRTPLTEAEFKNSDVGVKYSSLQSEIGKEAGAASREWAIKILRDAASKNSAELKSKGFVQ